VSVIDQVVRTERDMYRLVANFDRQNDQHIRGKIEVTSILDIAIRSSGLGEYLPSLHVGSS
jgi:hypothetical protein